MNSNPILALSLCLLISGAAFQEDREEDKKDPRNAIQVLETGHYFRYQRKPVALLGGGARSVVLNPSIGYKQLNETLARHGVNVSLAALSGQAQPEYQPFLRQPDGRFDLSTYNPAFWGRLKNYLASANDFQIVVLLEVFDEASTQTGANLWAANPWNPKNNVQNLGALSSEDGSLQQGRGPQGSFFDASNVELARWQAAFLDKLITETLAAQNVVYHLPGPPQWVRQWIELFVRREEGLALAAKDKKNKKRPMARSLLVSVPLVQQEYFADAGIDAIGISDLLPAPDGSGRLKAAEHYQKIVAFFRRTSKPLLGQQSLLHPAEDDASYEDFRREIWLTFMGGGHFISRNVYRGAGSAEGGQLDSRQLEIIGSLRKFVESIPFWKMHPSSDITPNGYVLVEPSKAIALYLPDSTEVQVNTSTMKGTLIGRWYDIRSGEALHSFAVQAGGPVKLQTPRRGDWALSLAAK